MNFFTEVPGPSERAMGRHNTGEETEEELEQQQQHVPLADLKRASKDRTRASKSRFRKSRFQKYSDAKNKTETAVTAAAAATTATTDRGHRFEKSVSTQYHYTYFKIWVTYRRTIAFLSP